MEDATANLVIESLHERGAVIVRIDPADLGTGLRFSAQLGDGGVHWAGHLKTTTRDIALEQVRAIYYRRPSPWSFDSLSAQSREFAIAEARHGFHGLLTSLAGCTYVSHPAAISQAEFKPAQLQVAAQVGFRLPNTLITNDLEAAQKFAAANDPMIYKSFRGVPRDEDGNCSVIWTQRVDPGDLDESLNVTAHLFQSEVPKDSDVRVTVVGSRAFASEITSPDAALDWRSGDWAALDHRPIHVPETIMGSLSAFLDAFGLAFGCFDFALEKGNPDRWTFIECNPNGQWGWLPDAGAIADALADTLLEGWFG